jgi:NTE family protein
MRKLLQLVSIFFIAVLPQYVLAQDKKPKVAIVLSGGGAKGIAHIPFLQALDSLGIVPDLVVGTSMGSVVGGLYAMGYSGDRIANITDNANWDHLLSKYIALTEVTVEEKSEFNKYLIDLDLKEGKLKVNSALVKDQNLRLFLSTLTYPAYKIDNFDDLSIPFRAIATDIVNGKEVIIAEGSLMEAMRASMSIPGIFKPISYKKTLLVDGGILNNFPTDIAKNMGADIIIGSDVSSGMVSIEKLDNIPNLLFQAGMLASNIKNPENRKRCDILIDHEPYMSYSTGDFSKSNEIYKEGKIALLEKMSALVDLAEKLKDYPKRTHKLPYAEKESVLDTIIYKGISKANLELVRARTNIQRYKKYTVETLFAGVNRAMATNIFSQITFTPVLEGNKTGLLLTGLEKSRNQIKGSLHYDSYRGIGLIINYTGRNIIAPASRFLVNLDIAEQPSFRLQYQKNYGPKKKWWWRSEALGQRLSLKNFVDGQTADDIKYRFFQFDNQFNRNIISLKSYVGVGMNYKYARIKPKVDPEINDNLLDLNRYNFNTIEVYAHYQYNSRNEVFYATRGTYFKANLGRSLMQNANVDFYADTNTDVKGATNGFTKLGADYEKRISFKKEIIGIIGASANFIFEDQLKTEDVSFTDFGYAAKYFLGGNLVNPRKESYIFSGLNEDELNVSQFMKLDLGVQFNIIHNLYITPHYSIATVGFDDFSNYVDSAFSPKGSWQDRIETSLVMSAGANISYDSFMGPVSLDVSWANDINKVRVFFSVGIPLNRSN